MVAALARVAIVQVFRESATILVAFALGVIVTLAAVFTTGGIYEYRISVEDDAAQQAINVDHWELLSNPRTDHYYYLRRPWLRVP